MPAQKLQDKTRIKNLIIKGTKLGFTRRELGRAFNLTHPAINYYVKQHRANLKEKGRGSQ